ncbi:ribosomal-processing cysteine protease Prp [Candidatus Desantisbacteria bacterium]|nr:ribosomal-processing cysteine protease Prp [Candidatus Desantisbacteria bacterium]
MITITLKVTEPSRFAELQSEDSSAVAGDDTREITEFWITGHADYKSKEIEKDIVCAAVSAVAQTAVEGLKRYLPERIHVKKDKGLLHVEIIKEEATRESLVILETMLLGLKRIEENYPEHVRVTIT